ncbi:MAG TPA: hypothetical protein H9775_10255, partial [Candidatus Blautia merdipullorum]|nr:hypothetical protein [Candidatus Blautia merdipullorum]
MQESETENEIRYVLFRCGIIIQKEILVPYKKLFKVGDFMSDLDIIEKISIVIGCHFTQLQEIDYRNNNAHYVINPDTGHVCGLRLPMRTRVIPPDVFKLTHLTVL